MIKKAITIALAALFLPAIAHADLSIEQSQTYKSNGQTTTQNFGVSPSDFDAAGIYGTLLQFSTGNLENSVVYGITPAPPSRDALGRARNAYLYGSQLGGLTPAGLAQDPATLNQAQALQFGRDQQQPTPPTTYTPGGAAPLAAGVFPQVVNWAAWGIQKGWIDPSHLSRAYASCIRQQLADLSAENILFSKKAGICGVQAYIQAYAVNPQGYAGGNMKGLIPLCEVQQGNDCNITGGEYDPWAIFKARLRKTEQQIQAQESSQAAFASTQHAYEVQHAALLAAGKTAEAEAMIKPWAKPVPPPTTKVSAIEIWYPKWFERELNRAEMTRMGGGQ